MPVAMARVYRCFRVANVVVLLASLVAVIVLRPTDPLVIASIALVWLFAVAEYVNYFVMRLAYPVTRWFAGVAQRRRPQLMRDVESAT